MEAAQMVRVQKQPSPPSTPAPAIITPPVTIDVEAETLLTPNEALQHPALRKAKNKRPHVSMFYRLCDNGARARDGSRVRLEFVIVPGGRRTSAQAIERLVHRL